MKVQQEKMEQGFAQEIDFCYKRLDELKAKAANLRKAAKDPVFAEFLLKNVRTKIQYAEISRDPSEIDRIKQTLEEAAAELKDAESEITVDIKKEIDDLAAKH